MAVRLQWVATVSFTATIAQRHDLALSICGPSGDRNATALTPWMSWRMDAIYPQVGATSPYGIVAGERIALALIKGTNLRGIVALTVHFERRAEHFRRELFDGVPDRFGGPGKAPIPQPRTAFCREQLGGCRIVEGGHEANIDVFRKRRSHLESIIEIQRLLRASRPCDGSAMHSTFGLA